MMKTSYLTALVVLFLLHSIFERETYGQLSVELNAGAGYTGVNIDAWSPGNVADRGYLMGEASMALFPVRLGSVSLGAEFGYQHFFSYSYLVPGYGTYEEVQSDALRLLALLRVDLLSNLFADVGPGAIFFSDWTDFGVMASIGYMFNQGKAITFPVRMRTEVVIDEKAILYPVSLSAGVVYTFNHSE
jgi:hypothetical protein